MQGHVLKRPTEEIYESIAGLQLALCQVTSHVVHDHVVYDLCVDMIKGYVIEANFPKDRRKVYAYCILISNVLHHQTLHVPHQRAGG